MKQTYECCGAVMEFDPDTDKVNIYCNHSVQQVQRVFNTILRDAESRYRLRSSGHQDNKLAPVLLENCL